MLTQKTTINWIMEITSLKSKIIQLDKCKFKLNLICNTIVTPIETLTKHDEKHVETKERYQKLVSKDIAITIL